MESSNLPDPTAEQSKRQRAHYYANVTMIDQQVGEIVEVLEARGDLDNTINVFTSDHGDALGDHGHSQKWNMYQSTVKVPALVAGPGIAQGRRISDNVALFDFAANHSGMGGCGRPPVGWRRRRLPPISGMSRFRRAIWFLLNIPMTSCCPAPA